MQTATGPVGEGGRGEGGLFLPTVAGEEMCKCDGLIGFNPQRRMVGARHHVGKERPERDSAQQQFDAVLDAIRGGNL